MPSRRALQRAADQASKAFEVSERSNGEECIVLSGDAPDWLVSREWHTAIDGTAPRLPSDWIYEKAQNIFLGFAEVLSHDLDADLERAQAELVDAEIDTYTSDLLAWLADSDRNIALVDEARHEMGADVSTERSIVLGQFFALERLANCVLEQLWNGAAEIEEEILCGT